MYDLDIVKFRNNKWAVRRTTFFGRFRYLSMFKTVLGETGMNGGKRIVWSWHKVDQAERFQLDSITEAEHLVLDYINDHTEISVDYGSSRSRATAHVPVP
jgi:hypothetical protein